MVGSNNSGDSIERSKSGVGRHRSRELARHTIHTLIFSPPDLAFASHLPLNRASWEEFRMAAEVLVGIDPSSGLQIVQLTGVKTRKHLFRRQTQSPHLPERSCHPHHQTGCLHHRPRRIREHDAQRPEATGNSTGKSGC